MPPSLLKGLAESPGRGQGGDVASELNTGPELCDSEGGWGGDKDHQLYGGVLAPRVNV